MATDESLDTLHRFAESLGMKREWFQDHNRVPHYDLTRTRRAAAIKAGAISVSTRELIRRCRKTEEPPSTSKT